MRSYDQFLRCKRISDRPTGLDIVPNLNPEMFPFQQDITGWALRRGRACVFADCGMGKTLMQLEWANNVPGRVLIATPLAVAAQTVREAEKFGISGAKYLRDDDKSTRIVVTNYEMIEHFSPERFDGVVLDESSILKSYTGKFRNYMIDQWGRVPFRLCATATPAPNDFMELGNHAEFIGAMTRADMLSMFFVHDGGETQKWRLKGHAENEFWKWLCSWAVMIRKPSDLGYPDGDFVLPKLHVNQVSVHHDPGSEGMLFTMDARTMAERRDARKGSLKERVAEVARMVNAEQEPWLVWCDRNDESELLTKSIPGAKEVKGSSKNKEELLNGFSNGDFRVLVTKPSIAGWGMNWQHCRKMAFTGLSDSYEQFYQAVRRCWRFGQCNEVTVHVVTATTEGEVVKNIMRKEKDSKRMADMMTAHMRDITAGEISGTTRNDKTYTPKERINIPQWMS